MSFQKSDHSQVIFPENSLISLLGTQIRSPSALQKIKITPTEET